MIDRVISVPPFETERLLLTAVTLADVDAYQRYFVDYEVIRFLSNRVPWPYPEEGVMTFIRDVVVPNQGKDQWLWALRLKTNPDELIGVVHLFREGCPEHRGFWLGRKFWGRGFMTEAVAPVTEYAFEQLGFETLVFSNARGNDRSRRIKEKTGAQFVGIQPVQFVDPDFVEAEVWSLSKTDWLRALRNTKE